MTRRFPRPMNHVKWRTGREWRSLWRQLRATTSPRSLYAALTLAIVVLCSSWTIVAGLACDPAQAQRGGAVGVALALLALFLRPNLGEGLLRDIDRAQALAAEAARRAGAVQVGAGLPQLASDPHDKSAATTENAAQDLRARLSAIEAAIVLEAKTQDQNIRWLAAASAIGTIFWGFADIPAAMIASCGGQE